MNLTIKSLLIAGLALVISSASAQKYVTKNGQISFFSQMALEKIEAHNNQVNSALDVATGDFVFKVLIRGFEFEKSLMQEHFNENYMESEKYPNSLFKGKITNIRDINFGIDGKYNVTVEGDLTIHNVVKKVVQKGTIEIRKGDILAAADFNILLKDYNIKIPNTVINNISETLEVKVNVDMQKLKN